MVEQSRALFAVREVRGSNPAAANLFRVMRMRKKDHDFFFTLSTQLNTEWLSLTLKSNCGMA